MLHSVRFVVCFRHNYRHQILVVIIVVDYGICNSGQITTLHQCLSLCLTSTLQLGQRLHAARISKEIFILFHSWPVIHILYACAQTWHILQFNLFVELLMMIRCYMIQFVVVLMPPLDETFADKCRLHICKRLRCILVYILNHYLRHLILMRLQPQCSTYDVGLCR